jgi:geranylgeranyl diphosphate synthase type II
MAVARGDSRPKVSDVATAALEPIHCASFVHDDMPGLDNADLRRGKPAVYTAFGEPITLLTGDSLIIMVFEVLARAAAQDTDHAITLLLIVGESLRMPRGTCAVHRQETEEKSIFPPVTAPRRVRCLPPRPARVLPRG